MYRSTMTQIEYTDMINMRKTTLLAMLPIECHRAVGLISMMWFLHREVRRSAGPRVSLIQFEVDSQVEDDIDRLSVERSRFELPAPHCIDGSLIETERQRLEDLHVR